MTTASEKLRELQWISPQPLVTNRSGVFIALNDWRKLMDALPLIADVVEAAEDLAAWSVEQQAATGSEMLTSLALRIERDHAALAALDAALERK